MDLKEFLEANPEFGGVSAKDIKMPKAAAIKKQAAVVGSPTFYPIDGPGDRIMIRLPFYVPAFAPEAERKAVWAKMMGPIGWFKGEKPLPNGDPIQAEKDFNSYRMNIGRIYKPLLDATGTTFENVEGQIVVINANPMKDDPTTLEVVGIQKYVPAE